MFKLNINTAQNLAAKRAQAAAQADATKAEEYLLSTDWMVIRSIEAGVPVPADVAATRADARVKADSKGRA